MAPVQGSPVVAERYPGVARGCCMSAFQAGFACRQAKTTPVPLAVDGVKDVGKDKPWEGGGLVSPHASVARDADPGLVLPGVALRGAYTPCSDSIAAISAAGQPSMFSFSRM